MQALTFSNLAAAPLCSDALADYPSQLISETLIGVSRWTQTARKLVALHAAHDEPIILEGEHGTGKKLLARLIHRLSGRHEGPFISLALGSSTPELARAVLLGAAPCSSGDARAGEKGFIELSQGGTLYIGGVSELSQALMDDIARIAHRRHDGQRRVRVMLGRYVQSVKGRSRPIAAAAGIPGLDYDRIQIPPLRERPDDIEALAEHFIKERCSQMGKELRRISPDAMGALGHYDWPRNAAELKMLVNQLVKQSNPPSIDASMLPAYLAGSNSTTNLLPPSGLDLETEVRRVEVDLICAALRQSRGLQNKAAELLRIKPTTLFMKIRRLGIDVGAFR